MKKLKSITIAIALAVMLSSCGVSGALVLNDNSNATQVQLAGANYKVLEKISGSADVSYILMIGGIYKKQLYENAYAAMLEKADLEGKSRALINVVTEEHAGGFFPFYVERTITVSAHVIEFTR